MTKDKVKQFLDKILLKVGLVRNTVHQSKMQSWETYAGKLGEAAKEKGVKVVFNDERLDGILIDSDVFVLGSRNAISNCRITTGVYFSPSCQMNLLMCNSFGEAVDFKHFTFGDLND